MDSFLARALRLLMTGDTEVYSIAWTSLRFSLVSVTAAAVISLPLGVLLGLREFRGRRTVLAALNSLMALPTVLVGLLVYSLLSRAGPLGAWGLLFRPSAVIIGQTLLCFPIIASLVTGALSRLDPNLRETLVTLGASAWQRLRMIVRECRLALLSALLAGFGRVIGEVGVSMMLGGNIRFYTRTLTTAIALETSKGEFELGLALGMILLLLALAVNFSLHWMVKHER
jgi:tungstate transport system permease protein